MISLLSSIGLVLLIISGVAAVLGIILKNSKIIIGSLIVFWVIFAAYFFLLPGLMFMQH